MKKYSRKKLVVATIALLVLAFSGLSILSTLRGGPFLPFDLKPMRGFRSTGGSDAKIVDWRISASPAMVRSDDSVLQPHGGQAFAPRTMSASPPKPAPPKSPGPPSVEIGVVKIRVEIEFLGTNAPTCLWPKADTLQVLRAEGTSGQFSELLRFGPDELGKVTPSVAPGTLRKRNVPFDTSNPSRGWSVVTEQDPDDRRGLLHFSIVDSRVEPGVPYRYRLQFLGPWKKTLATSGDCSAVPLPLPAPEMKFNAEGFPHLDWPQPRMAADSPLRDARCRIELAGLHELARFPFGAGSYRVPFKTNSPVGQRLEVRFIHEASVTNDTWTLQSGQRSHPVRETLARSIPLPSVPSPVFGRREEAGAVLVVTDTNSVARGTGEWQVSCRLASHVRLLSLEVSTPSGGTQVHSRKDKSIYRLRGYDHTEPAGISERCAFTYTWPVYEPLQSGKLPKESGQVITARVSAVRSPLPGGLSAVAGDGSVKLSWDTFAWDPGDWVEGPFFVLRRWEADPSKPQEAASQERIVYYAGAKEGTQFTDTAVTNGGVYFYSAAVEGVTRATSWVQDVGEYECHVPVHVRSDAVSGQGRVVAAPRKLRPVSVALLAVATEDARVNALQAHSFRVLRALPWMELLERSVGASLLEEIQVARLQSSDAAVAPAADVILQCRVRQAGYSKFLDIWLDDYKNSQRERLVSEPLENFALEKFADRLVKELAARFPSQVAAFPAGGRELCAPIRSIAVSDLRPLSKPALPEGQIESLLIAAVARDECVKVVEREKLRLALKELAATKLTEQQSALQLGKLVAADAILSGYYEVAGDQVALSARLIDAGTGQILNIFDLTGSLTDPQSLCQQLARQVLAASKIGKPNPDSPLLRWMEAKAYGGSPDRLSAAKTAAYVSPETPDHHFQVGQEQRAAGQFEDALASFYNGLNLAEKKEDPWRFYKATGELLEQLKRPEESVQLWQRAVADRQRRNEDATVALLNLASAFHQLRRDKEAAETLDRIPKQGRPYLVGRGYEAVGRTMDAIAVYGDAVWSRVNPYSQQHKLLGPGYAALIRLIHTGPPEAQKAALRAIAVKACDARPHQAKKALDELLRSGATLDLELIQSLQAGKPANAQDPRFAALEKIAKDDPKSLEAMRALTQLGNLYRMLGDDAAANERSQKVADMNIHGAEADLLRQQAQMRLQMPSRPARPPTSPAAGASTNAPPRNHALIAQDADGRLVVDSAAMVYRLNRSGDAVVWRFDPRARSANLYGGSGTLWYNMNYGIDHHISDLQLLASAMVVETDTLFAPNLVDGTLAALDVRSGVLRWTFVDWAPITKPLLRGDRLYVGNSLGELSELSKKDGTLIRRVRCPPEVIEHGYYDQLLKLDPIADGSGFRFVNPRLTGTYRMSDGLREIEFESHRVWLDHGRVEIVDPRAAGDPMFFPRAVSNTPTQVQVTVPSRVRVLRENERNPPALQKLVRDANEPPRLRAQAIGLLGEMCGAAALPTLEALADDSAAEVRAAAAQGLTKLGDARHRGLLKRLLGDSNAMVRSIALEALVRTAGTEARADLAAILNDPGSPLRARAAMALVRAGDRSAIDVLRQADPSQQYLRDNETLVALCRANDPDAIEELRRRFDFTDTSVSPYDAAWLVANFLPEARFVSLVQADFRLLSEHHSREVFVQALDAIGDPSSIPLLIAAVRSGGPGESGIVTALENLTGKSFGSDRTRWETWWRQSAPSELKAGPAKSSP